MVVGNAFRRLSTSCATRVIPRCDLHCDMSRTSHRIIDSGSTCRRHMERHTVYPRLGRFGNQHEIDDGRKYAFNTRSSSSCDFGVRWSQSYHRLWTWVGCAVFKTDSRPGRYGDAHLLKVLLRRRAQIEGDIQHTLAHANLLLSKTATLQSRLSASQHHHTAVLPSEILEHIISHLAPESIDMEFAKASVTWFLATLAATRQHLRSSIKETEGLMCLADGETVVLDCDSSQYPPGTEIRWVPIKHIETQSREVMRWCDALCRVVGFKL